MEYSQILKDLRRESGGVKNRIQLIIFDSKYVQQMSDSPIVANERCGLWYVEPTNRAAGVYFKSTDGHTGQWKFSLRRLNFHMLDLFRASQTLVLVDSTRKGKLMPDALLKTVPIWCAVLNFIMFDGEIPEGFAGLAKDNWLVTPREMVSESEHSTIAKLIPQHAREVQKLGLISKEGIIKRLGLKKPIVPHWMYPTKKDQKVHSSDEFFSICCLTASYKSTSGKDVPGWHFQQPYVQGAADDHELWALEICGGKFDDALLWNDIYYEPSEELRVVDMATGDISSWLSEEEFLSRITKIYESRVTEKETPSLDLSALRDTGISIGQITENLKYTDVAQSQDSVHHVIIISSEFTILEVPQDPAMKINVFKIESLKKGAKQLREALPKIVNQIETVHSKEKVLIFCDTGKDLSAGVALSILGRKFDTNWQPVSDAPHVNKDIIKQHLCSILDCRQVNPSRNTLQSVNTFLMGDRSGN